MSVVPTEVALSFGTPVVAKVMVLWELYGADTPPHLAFCPIEMLYGSVVAVTGEVCAATGTVATPVNRTAMRRITTENEAILYARMIASYNVIDASEHVRRHDKYCGLKLVGGQHLVVVGKLGKTTSLSR